MRFGQFAVVLVLLAGCLATPDVLPLSDVALDENTAETGLIAPEGSAPETVLEGLENVEKLPAAEAKTQPATDATPPKKRRGLAALFGRRNKDTDPGEENADADVADENQDPVDTAAAVDVAATIDTGKAEDAVDVAPAPTPKPARKGLFGPRRAASSKFAQAPPGVMLPFGQIGLACGLRGKQLGKEVDRFPKSGKGYRLFDSNPATTQPRTHYITGFKDGCARQFTASLALLESPVLHEQLLSVKSSQSQHATKADVVFQKIRAQVCQVGRGKACPEKRIDEMEKSMVFVTTYERFGGNANWTEILMHNGVVAASSSQIQ